MKAVVFHSPFELAVEQVPDPKIEAPLDAVIRITTANICGSDTDVVQAIMDLTDRFGVDCGVEAVGYQAHDPSGQEHPELVLDNLIQVVRATGRLGVVGVYMPEDPGGVDEQAKQGRPAFDFGTAWNKGLSIGTGQCPVKRYNRYLRDLIIRGQANPSAIVSHEPPLGQAVEAYDKFDKRVDGYTKVLLHPSAA